MLAEGYGGGLLYTPDRSVIADPVRRLWYPDSARAGGRRVLPTTAYCRICRGEKKLINSPFRDKCCVATLSLPELSKIPMEFPLSTFVRSDAYRVIMGGIYKDRGEIRVVADLELLVKIEGSAKKP